MRGRQQQMAPDEEPEKDEEQEQKEIIDRQIRTHKALQYMERELQLPTATVMPVLLKLMKVGEISNSGSLSIAPIFGF